MALFNNSRISTDNIPRSLTSLELRRITGKNTPIEQLNVFATLGIPAHPRNPTGYHIIECLAYTNEVRPFFTDDEWAAIDDENIGTLLLEDFLKQA